ncbi:4-hydroxybenzoate octaprenyltransferase [Roseospira marina]|uniref:4-hydroxybenzoate octaprenyltransferase n=1 Tax=Roseospira marina TaxID=140057 RepID=A0A5M6I6I2_9PROT|nr:4-hydroxybenzoate octaprenyltransferase [Roseospira marina]KAA5603477.1 4-hydroxybenzoate octaprenyltransferase [Roseospira marina]MBB4316150.1 4-hydroxybenzoate polyprenyltransferase [Roseospira marina]MBB5089346.1 4-hydroxybenzoate polyprenyltransferase [Roseospira marina]
MARSAELIGDMPVGGWVDRMLPAPLLPYAKLTRIDRPIGCWLLLWPCWWSTAMAADASTAYLPDPVLLILFLIGSVVMRSAGCAFNDIVDKDFDAKVARTAARPIASGALSRAQAILFLIGLGLIGLAVLVSLNTFAIVVGLCSLPLVFTYPFMKRITYWPQAWLGITFTYGALMGWAGVRGELDVAAFALYAGCFFWTLHYDTVYAHQDKEDDLIVGVKSSALALGDKTRPALLVFISLFMGLVALSGWLAGLHWAFFVLLALPAGHLLWQTLTVSFNDTANCLATFKSNRHMGWMLFVAIVVGRVLAGDGSV